MEVKEYSIEELNAMLEQYKEKLINEKETTDKINWKQKFSSRKFWALLVALIAPLSKVFNWSSSATTEIISIVSIAGACVAYMLVEGVVDKTKTKGG